MTHPNVGNELSEGGKAVLIGMVGEQHPDVEHSDLESGEVADGDVIGAGGLE